MKVNECEELERDFEEFMELFNSIKERVRKANEYKYQQWKAGGFVVDSDVMSMYPNLGEVIESLEVEEDEYEED